MSFLLLSKVSHSRPTRNVKDEKYRIKRSFRLAVDQT
jgi:hypothetical protein